ncbi:hypothetical protein [Streptomyces regalis]|uniref:Uncharacterized protein n=1 Tax=Streptomyces regalis TaxID=68262 RepID=A0A101JEU8_9ACTN|nr:hypothetical protein [Streptomyces regalis]KUL25356.1 hypothetical protein ADL12_35100 [Streptomyces regalis]
MGLRGEERAQRGRNEHSAELDVPERLGIVAQVVALICLILAAAAHLFARTSLSREAYHAFDAFRAVTYVLAWIALGGAVAAFALPLLIRGRSSGWPYALFIIPAAVILMMFTFLLRESRA